MCKTPGVAEFLRLLQIGFAAPQSFFCLFPILDFGSGAVPPNNLAVFIPVWVVKEKEPPVLPVLSEKSRFGLEGEPERDRAPSFLETLSRDRASVLKGSPSAIARRAAWKPCRSSG